MSARYVQAQEQHHDSLMREFYSEMSNSLRDVGIGSRPSYPFSRPYSKFRHYLPHSLSLGTVCIAGVVGIMAYNSATKQAFEADYFSSW